MKNLIFYIIRNVQLPIIICQYITQRKNCVQCVLWKLFEFGVTDNFKINRIRYPKRFGDQRRRTAVKDELCFKNGFWSRIFFLTSPAVIGIMSFYANVSRRQPKAFRIEHVNNPLTIVPLRQMTLSTRNNAI